MLFSYYRFKERKVLGHDKSAWFDRGNLQKNKGFHEHIFLWHSSSVLLPVLFGHFCSFVNVLRLLEFYFPDAYIPQREGKLIHKVVICIKCWSICHRLLPGWVWHLGIVQLAGLSIRFPWRQIEPPVRPASRGRVTTHFTISILTIIFLIGSWHNRPCLCLCLSL